MLDFLLDFLHVVLDCFHGRNLYGMQFLCCDHRIHLDAKHGDLLPQFGYLIFEA